MYFSARTNVTNILVNYINHENVRLDISSWYLIWNDTTVEPRSRISGPPYLKDWYDACAKEPTGNCKDFASLYPTPATMCR